MKETIKKMLANEAKYDDIIEAVTEEVIGQALVKTRGNQTLAAELLGMNRCTFRKYLNRMGSK
jgi:DNA-binding protein Fis